VRLNACEAAHALLGTPRSRRHESAPRTSVRVSSSTDLSWHRGVGPVKRGGPDSSPTRDLELCTGEMGLEAETGQPAPPARRARLAWYLTWRVPAAAAVSSPPQRGDTASGTPWAVLPIAWRRAGRMTGSRAIRCRADATASRCVLKRAETPDPSSVRASRPATRA
jgi:hypothetical protein